MNDITAEAVRHTETEPPIKPGPLAAQGRGPIATVETPVGATSLLEAITRAASNPQVDMDKMERLFAMHERIVAGEREAAFNAALARAQARIPAIVKDAYNDHTRSQYATLGAINDAVMPILAAEGLSISFNSGKAEAEGYLRTVAIVAHAAGHRREYYLDLPPDDVGAKGNVNKTGVQATGSTSSYARRYLVCMIVNVGTLDDRDGNPEGKRKPGPVPDPEGKAALEACASLDALKRTWNGLPEKQRNTLQEVMAECNRRIRAADKP